MKRLAVTLAAACALAFSATAYANDYGQGALAFYKDGHECVQVAGIDKLPQGYALWLYFEDASRYERVKEGVCLERGDFLLVPDADARAAAKISRGEEMCPDSDECPYMTGAFGRRSPIAPMFGGAFIYEGEIDGGDLGAAGNAHVPDYTPGDPAMYGWRYGVLSRSASAHLIANAPVSCASATDAVAYRVTISGYTATYGYPALEYDASSINARGEKVDVEAACENDPVFTAYRARTVTVRDRCAAANNVFAAGDSLYDLAEARQCVGLCDQFYWDLVGQPNPTTTPRCFLPTGKIVPPSPVTPAASDDAPQERRALRGFGWSDALPYAVGGIAVIGLLWLWRRMRAAR